MLFGSLPFTMLCRTDFIKESCCGLLLSSSLFDRLFICDTCYLSLQRSDLAEYSEHYGIWGKNIQIVQRRWSFKENEIVYYWWWFLSIIKVSASRSLFTVSLCGFSEIVRWTMEIPLRARMFKGTESERRAEGGWGDESGFLSEPPPGLVSAGWWLEQLLQLTKLPFPCQYQILCLTATHSAKSTLPAQRRSQKAIVPRPGDADMTAVHGEKKRGPLIEQTLAIFYRPETTALLLWDTEWDEDISGEWGQADSFRGKKIKQQGNITRSPV